MFYDTSSFPFCQFRFLSKLKDAKVIISRETLDQKIILKSNSKVTCEVSISTFVVLLIGQYLLYPLLLPTEGCENSHMWEEH